MIDALTVGYIASLLSVINQLPQAIKVFKTKDTNSISITMYILMIACISAWLWYGILLSNAPIIWANGLGLIPICYIFAVKLHNTIAKRDKWTI